jgi:hypothetical protein
MLLMVAGSVTFTWIAVAMQRAKKQHRAAEEVRRLGGLVYYREQGQHQRLSPELRGQPPEPGDDFWSSVRAVVFSRPEVSDDALAPLLELKGLETVYIRGPNALTETAFFHLSKLTNLKGLSLSDMEVSDAALLHLSKLVDLKYLYISNVKVTDDGLRCLASLTQLEILELRGLPITDMAMAHLRPLCKLESLTISETPITDEGLMHLESLASLDTLRIPNTRVTGKGLEKLKTRLPRCRWVVTEWNR